MFSNIFLYIYPLDHRANKCTFIGIEVMTKCYFGTVDRSCFVLPCDMYIVINVICKELEVP